MSFFFLLLYMFCTIIRPQDWMQGVKGLPIVDGLTFAIVLSLLIERLGSKKGMFLSVPQNKFMLGLFAAVVISHIVHTYFEGAVAAFSSFLIIFVLYFLLLNGINSQWKFKLAVWFIVTLIFILVPQGIFQMENGYGWAGQDLTKDFETLRINWIGIFSDPNDLALAFVVAVGVLVAFFFGKTGFIQRILIAIMIGFLFYGIYLTNSRGGFLALITTILFYFVKRTKRFVIGGIVGGIFAIMIFALGPSRLGLISVEEDSAYGRINLWYEGILLMRSNPIFGVGYDMFEEDLPQTAHNSYILAGAELGLVGLFFWMALIYCSFKELSLVQKTEDRLKSYAYGLQSGLVGFCAAAFFLSRTYIMIPYLLFALSGSLMHIVKERFPEANFQFTRRDARNTFWLSIGVLLLAYVTIKVGI